MVTAQTRPHPRSRGNHAMNTKRFRWLTGGACPRRYSSRRYSRSECRIPLPLPCAQPPTWRRTRSGTWRPTSESTARHATFRRRRTTACTSGVPGPQETHPAQMKRRDSALVGGGPGSLNNSRNSKVLKGFRLKERSCGFPVRSELGHPFNDPGPTPKLLADDLDWDLLCEWTETEAARARFRSDRTKRCAR